MARDFSANGSLAVQGVKKAFSQALEFPLEAGPDFEHASYEPSSLSKEVQGRVIDGLM